MVRNGTTGRGARRRLRAGTALSQRFEFETFEPRVLMSADLLPVHGVIDVPGQTNQYTFSLTDAKQIYFDSQTPSSQIDWTLKGPSGTVVSARPFASSDANQVAASQATLSLPAGDYTLSVAGQGNATGVYDFHLLDLANATPVTLGRTIDGQLAPADATNLYQFTASAGDTVFFDSHTLDQQGTTWRVLGPEGSVVFDRTPFGQDPGPETLAHSGTYTLLVEGNVGGTGTADYSFTVFPVTTASSALALGQTVTDTLPTPGALHEYDLVVTQPTKVVFDSLTNRADLQWSLTGSAGDLVSQRGFNQSDGAGIAGDDGVMLAAGSYRLTVGGVGPAVGGYGFRLLDIASATPAALGDTQGGTLDDAGFAAFLAHSAAGAPLVDAAASRSLTLGDAQVAAAVAPSALLQSQALTVEAWVQPSFNASGQGVVFQQGAAGAGYALQLGQDGRLQFVVDGALVEAPSVLRLGVWTHVAGSYDGSTLRLYVNGVDVADRAFAGPVGYDANGATIGAADGVGDAAWNGGIDELRIWNVARSAADILGGFTHELAAQAGLVALYHFNEATGLVLADGSGHGLDAVLGPVPGVSTQLLGFSLTAGQSYFLNAQAASGAVQLRLYNPAGFLVSVQPFVDHAAITAELSGTYVLAVEGGIGNVVPASFSLRLVPSVSVAASLVVGATVSGGIGLPGQSVAYGFTLAGETRVLFDTLAADAGLQFTLTGPQGAVVTGESLRAADGVGSGATPALDLVAGAYTLTVSAVGAITGSYSFRLLDMAGATAFALGSDVVAPLDQPAGNVLYSFSGTAGDTVSFNLVSGDYGTAWRLLDPYGRTVFGPQHLGSQSGIALGATGTYVLSIEGAVGAGFTDTVEFTSSLDSHADPAALSGTALVLGNTVSGSFTAAGAADDYVFTVAAGARLYFDSLVADNVPVAFSLVGPRGVEIGSTPFSAADGSEAANPSEIDLPVGGIYRLRVTNGGYVGAYAFRLLDLTQPASVLAVDGGTFNATLSPANSTAVYQFAGVAGSRVFLAATRGDVGYGGVDLRLIDPYGRDVTGALDFASRILAIGSTGTYTLLVEGDRNNAYYVGSVGVSLALSTVGDPAPVAMAVGQAVSGQVAAGSETNRYTFTLASAARLVLASFTGDATAVLSLIGADGTISQVDLAQAQGYGQGSPAFALAAGSYTLAITGATPVAAPSYAFRLVDLAGAQPLVADTVVSGVLQNKQDIAVYAVSAAAGSQLRVIATQSGQGYYDRILVLDAAGRPLGAPTGFGNDPVFQIAVTGTYTVIFEGEAYGAPGTTPFTIAAYVDPPPTPVGFGVPTAATLADSGAIVRYGFTLGADSNILFNSLTGDGNLSWTLSGPDGYSLNRNFYYSGGYELGGTSPVLALRAGDYVLTFSNATNTARGTYFQLLNLDAATSLVPGTILSNADAQGNQTLIYSFDATAGVPVSLTTSDPANVLSVRLIDPFGQEVFGPQQTGLQLVTPGATGRYTVLVEGRVYDATPRPFTIGVAGVPRQTIALTGLASPQGAVTQPGRIGGALSLDGLTAIRIDDQPAVDLGASLTLEAWINPDRMDAGFVPLIVKSGGYATTYGLFLVNGNRLGLGISDAANRYNLYTNYGVIPFNAWTHVAGVVDAATHLMTIYLNGVQVAQQGYGGYAPVDDGTPLLIGNETPANVNGDGYYEGLIDDVRLWRVARTAAEIAAAYQAPLAGTEAGLAVYLPLDDAAGSAGVSDLGPNRVTASLVSS